MSVKSILMLSGCVTVLAWSGPTLAQTTTVQSGAQQVDGEGGIGEIVVTAQRRQESANSIPLSIAAISGDALNQRNVNSTADLAKLVPGFSAQETGYDAPVYTLRGVGFFDYSLTAGTTVSVYTDEVSLPFSVMTKAAALDLARVEVLKGPQGTLYGQNATGGAINYIANKPTDHFEAGLRGSYSRFNTADLQGFISGPLADNLNGRLSVRTTQGGDWQKSYTRNDSLGETHVVQGRVLLDWKPTESLKFTLNVNGWLDKSDTLAAQVIKVSPLTPPTDPNAINVLQGYPLAPENNRAADWTPGKPFKRDDSFYQFALRADYEIAPSVTLTSITAYEQYRARSQVDFDGTRFQVDDVIKRGQIRTFSQELRAQADLGNAKIIVGGNYERDTASDLLVYVLPEESNAAAILPGTLISQTSNLVRNRISTYAGFGNIDYSFGEHVTVHGGVRYTQSNRNFYGCLFDGGDGNLAAAFTFLDGLFNGAGRPPLSSTQCLTFSATLQPSAIVSTLKENNVSWRAGIDYKTDNGSLFYLSASKGYKSGSFPTLAASSYTQFFPVTQESVLAYEAGVKLPLFERKLQLNAAAFYYDYRNKQVQGRSPDPIFGPLSALVNIPKSRVEGAEAQVIAAPFAGLRLSGSATYLKTKIIRFTGYDQDGLLQNFAGTEVPISPRWNAAGDAQYDWAVGGDLTAFLGAGVTYTSSSFAQLGENPLYRIKSAALLDLRAGIRGPNDKWQIQVWGNNVTNTYNYSNVFRAFDTILRFPGKPVTYGITASVKFD